MNLAKQTLWRQQLSSEGQLGGTVYWEANTSLLLHLLCRHVRPTPHMWWVMSVSSTTSPSR